MADEQPQSSIENQPQEIVFYWTFPEYEPHHHTQRWWVWFWGVSLVFIFIAMWTSNFLFAIIILIFDILIVYRHHTPPLELECIISETQGLAIGERIIPFKRMKSFWLVENHDEPHRLYVTLSSGFRSHLSISVPNEINTDELKNFLSRFVTEDQEQEHELIGDTLSKILKI